MAFTHGSKARALFSGYDLSPYLTGVQTSGTNDVAEVTALSNEAKAYIAGLSDATMTLDGLLDPGDGRSEQRFLAALGGTVQATHFPAGTAIAARGIGLEGIGTSDEIGTDTESAAKIMGEIQSKTGAEPVTVHRSGGTVTGGGTATVQDNAAGTGAGGHAYLQALSINGGTAVVKVQHSADNVTFTDLATFADVTALNAPKGQRVATSGTVHRYTRATWTATGGTADFIVAFGRK